MATQQQAASAAQRAAQQQQINNQFMGLSYEQPFAALAQNGTAYVPGQTLNFDCPVIPGGYLTRLILSVNLTVTNTPGTGSIALNAGGIWNVINQINVKFGETQISVHPYAEYVFSLMRGYGRFNGGVGQTDGNQNAGIQSILYSAPSVASGAQTWKFDIEVPLNSVHPNSVNGILPLGQTGTKCQVQVIPPSSFTGPDPLNNVVALTGNATVSVAGNVTCTAIVRDFKSLATVTPVEPSLDGLATVQTIKPQEINPLTAGSYNFKTLSNPYPLVRYCIIVIDGQSSATFTSPSNIVGYELDQAENTNSAFWRYDQTTGGMARYYAEVRRRFGQDFDSGVIVFDAPTMNQGNPSNMGGNNFLNLTSQGYPAARWGVNVSSVSNANGITPRAVMYATVINPAGISLV
jgi:hypothetical protein